jgi:DNA-binding CsgD family transcriptional regulator
MLTTQRGATAEREVGSAATEREGTRNIAVPRGLEAFRFEAGGEEFVLLTWPSAAPWRENAPTPLTPAEEAVAALAAAGLSNGDIARERSSSPRTVANQLASVFRKLGVASRLELYAYAGRRPEVGEELA